ncbi:hypothetical protein GCM10028807_15300 [Spirosoma daeguense]
MKIIFTTASICALLFVGRSANAQSTTGGRSGGSTASTGTGYLTEGSRPAETSASSMTIADEGVSRAYMYVPPQPKPNRAASPDGSKQPKLPAKPDSTKANMVKKQVLN